MPIVEISRHTDKDKVTGQATPEGIEKAKDSQRNQYRAITFGDGKVFCYCTSKARTQDTLDAIIESQLALGNTNFIYAGVASKMEEGGVEDYESQLVDYITTKLDVEHQVVEKFVETLWFECLMDADEHFFDNFVIPIEPGKKIARQAFSWLVEQMEQEENTLVISHGIVIGAIVYTLQKQLNLNTTLLPGNSRTYFVSGGPLQPLSNIIFLRDEECPAYVGVSFNKNQVIIPYELCLRLSE